MPSIFDIPNWSDSVTYSKNSAVKSSNLYYYSRADGNIGNTPSVGSSSWAGYANDPITNEIKPEFIWRPSYGSTVDNSPRVLKIQFGDGYVQRVKDGINNDLMVLDLTFEGRDTNEALAIIHFLKTREGKDSFLFTPPPPFNKIRLFVCQQFPTSINFYQNNTIRAAFEEVAK